MTTAARVILVPGAWMGSWVWEPTAARLREGGVDAKAVTLQGLERATPDIEVAAVRLEDHVHQVIEQATKTVRQPVILVSHSYSGIVATCAADRLRDRVIGLIHIGAFIPQHGRCLIDDWGGSDTDRAQERADIEAAGDLWRPPTRQTLDAESDLTADDRDFLASRFTPHPGRTILDAARLTGSVADQPSTYVTLSLSGDADAAWNDAPTAAKSAADWRRRHLKSGHWPMLSAPEAITDLLSAEIRHYEATGH